MVLLMVLEGRPSEEEEEEEEEVVFSRENRGGFA